MLIEENRYLGCHVNDAMSEVRAKSVDGSNKTYLFGSIRLVNIYTLFYILSSAISP